MNLNFSGHETFPFRQLWAYKASELLKRSKTPFTKDRDDSMMNMGLGANMLKSMSFWIKSSGLVERDKNGDHTLLPLGKLLLDDAIGDPYLERIESLWVIHHKLATNKAKNSTFYWIFNMNNNMVFSLEDYKRGVRQWYEKEELNLEHIPTEDTLKKDYNVTIGMYTPKSNKEDFEDSVQYPFWALGLIKQAHGVKQNYQLVKRSVCDIPSSIFNYTLIEYLRLTDQNEAVTFDQLLNDAYSPGRILQLSEHPLRIYLENVEKELRGTYVFDDTAGQRLLYIKGKLDGLKYLKKKIYK